MVHDGEYMLRQEAAEWECYLRIIYPLILLETKPKSLSVIFCEMIHTVGSSFERWTQPKFLERMVMGKPDCSDEDYHSKEDRCGDKAKEAPDKPVYGPDGVRIWPLVGQLGYLDPEHIIY